MASFNKVILIGHLTADPELKTTQSGLSVTSFSIGVNRRNARDGSPQQVDFINIVCWRQTAEFVTRYFTKGRPILVSGQLQTRTWVDNNNNKRTTVEVVADEVSFVDKKSDSAIPTYRDAVSGYDNGPSFASHADSAFEEMSTDDVLPF